MESDYALQYENLWRHHWWWQSRKQFVLSRLHRLARRQPLTPILDIGCGNGLFFEDLAQFGEVRGIEPDPLLVRDGPQRARVEVRPFDQAYVPPVRPNLVLMLDVLEHIDDDLAAARHVREILAPGGTFLLTVPALMTLWSRHDVANRHFRRYTRVSLHQVLAAAGFKIESLHYFFAWTLAPLLFRRLLAPGPKPEPKPGKTSASTTGASTRSPTGTETPPADTRRTADQSAEEPHYRVHVPAAPINNLLYGMSRLEQVVLGGWIPLGSSVLAIARAV